ncbi:uncharacterized protein LOC111596195 isoform X2 [Drosophila hydei]|uniref:Uncharacterized protein LOC111596195 isoform X2 n=1 Tax=Drosophila hydei TaxID=7224 RepID=A0A6J1LJV1_DROHY|nr:uncharacterized protein LOC111596195 isoform X2 [Drosophila hydei]
MLQFPRQKIKFSVANLSGTEGNEADSSCESLQKLLSRTSLLILDHKHFVAARTIQSIWRARRLREQLRREKNSARTIQRWWRGFHQRKRLFSIIEEKVQQSTIAHYNKEATKIQAYFRGWFTRQTVHDMHSLLRMQNNAAEELLNCVAYRLHHLLRTYSVPGIYSLRDSHCLSKVEKLLDSITYRFLNDSVIHRHVFKSDVTKRHNYQFNQNSLYTNVPFSGPNYNAACKTHLEDSLFPSKKMEACMYKVIREYEKSLADPKVAETHKIIFNRRAQEQTKMIWQNIGKVRGNFCGDVIDSMRKWNIWDDENLNINRNIYLDPNDLKNFLDDAERLLNKYTVSCYCRQEDLPKIEDQGR